MSGYSLNNITVIRLRFHAVFHSPIEELPRNLKKTKRNDFATYDSEVDIRSSVEGYCCVGAVNCELLRVSIGIDDGLTTQRAAAKTQITHSN